MLDTPLLTLYDEHERAAPRRRGAVSRVSVGVLLLPHPPREARGGEWQVRPTAETAARGCWSSSWLCSGYPGQGGCFYGGEGRCYVSQYRLVFVSDRAQENRAYQSFSLPFYGIRDWSFDVTFFGTETSNAVRVSFGSFGDVAVAGTKSWKGHVNQVPGGGLVGVGRFSMEFLSFGFDEFRSHVLPLLENSRALHLQFRDLTTPSVLMVPGKLERQDGSSRRLAFCSAEDPMTVFIVDKAPASSTDG